MFSSLQQVAQFAAAHAINAVMGGTVVALFAFAFLWAISCRNSGTRFAVWFSALLAVAGLSLVAVIPVGARMIGSTRQHFILPAAWAEYALVAWAVIALAGLLRIVVALAHVWRLKHDSSDVADSALDPELRQLMEECRRVRQVTLRISDTLRVPTAVGFFHPAVILPRWTIEELSSAELKAVILHELGHLRRGDDWTNLAQKILRALLFFHPVI
jgi:beta-lactamase regulating signal transducer with metallopeptidase domain